MGKRRKIFVNNFGLVISNLKKFLMRLSFFDFFSWGFFFLSKTRPHSFSRKFSWNQFHEKTFFNAIDDLWRGYVMRSKSPWAKKCVFFRPHQFGFLNHPYQLFQHALFSNWDFLFQPPVELVGIQTEKKIVNFNI